MAVNYDCVASIRTVASIRPQSNLSAFRALSANFKLKEVYLSRNCSSHVFAKRDGQASLESIWEIGSKKLSIFRAALEFGTRLSAVGRRPVHLGSGRNKK